MSGTGDATIVGAVNDAVAVTEGVGVEVIVNVGVAVGSSEAVFEPPDP